MDAFIAGAVDFIREFGIATFVATSVILTALVIINRLSKNHSDKVESRLDDTETLRIITKEDRSYLVRAQERNELLVESNMKMIKDLGECQTQLSLLKQEIEQEREEREEERQREERERQIVKEQWEGLVHDLREKIEDLRLRIVDLETINNSKDFVIKQLKERLGYTE